MSVFRTEITPEVQNDLLDYNSKLFLCGSCFTENIGERLTRLKFQVNSNPFGILYNPYSIANSLQQIVDQKVYSEEDLVLRDDLWHSVDHHGIFSGIDKDEVVNNINQSIKSAEGFLKETDFAFISLGSVNVYKYKSTGQIAANCHKIPASEFDQLALTVGETLESLNSILSTLSSFNSKIKVCFTVSPVRHWKDGPIDNAKSKSTLLLAISQLVDQNPSCFYFPSYEIMMDDLRDYRFYKADMIHPNDQAINYIWEKFTDTWMDKETRAVMAQVEAIVKAREHRPLFSHSSAHQKFQNSVSEKEHELKMKYPFIKL